MAENTVKVEISLTSKQVADIQLQVTNIITDTLNNIKSGKILDTPYLNKKEACNYLRISNNTLDTWISMGLPVIRIGKTVRFDKNSIYSWIQEYCR